MMKIWMEMIICWENLGIDQDILKTKISGSLLAFAGITSSLIAIFQGYLKNSSNRNEQQQSLKKLSETLI